MTPVSNNKPKFTITANSIEELAKSFAEAVIRTQKVDVVDAKKGGGQYAKWELGNGDGLTLANAELKTKAGIPLFLGMTVVLRKLTEPAQYKQALAQAATIRENRIDRLKAQLAALQGSDAGELSDAAD